jgi:NAD(P)H-hydrate epimerase
MLDYREIAVLDRNAQYLGIPTISLMECAGVGVAETVRKNVELSGKGVTIFAGLGNNGGDGLVAARHIAYPEDCNVRVVLLGNPIEIKSQIAKENFNRLQKAIEIITIDESNLDDLKNIKISSDVAVIDSMLGVGITGTLKSPYSDVVKLINSAPRIRASKKKRGKSAKTKKQKGKTISTGTLVISVDVPTGLGTITAVKPDITITFHDSKIGMTNKNSGKIIIHDIGIPKDAEKFVGPGELLYLPKIRHDSHKGDHGTLLVVCGGPYTGAPALVGLGALRTGVDLVHIATPHETAKTVATFSPNFIIHPLMGNELYLTVDDVNNILSTQKTIRADAIVMGPGLGREKDTINAVIKTIKNIPTKIPIVLDADALTALSMQSKSILKSVLKEHTGVLTPHKTEFSRLLKAVDLKIKKSKTTKRVGKNQSKQAGNTEFEGLQAVVKSFTRKITPSWTVLLKGPVDIITDGQNLKLNETGNPGMTVGGTGDVLAGITGALLARGLTPYNAARAAAFINGYSGDLAWEKYRHGLTATDIIELIPQCLKDSLD